MKEANGIYTVYKGESVTIQIRPSVSLGAGQAVASRDGGVEPTLAFTVTKDVDQEHFVDVVYGFENVQPGASYGITIDGDSDDNQGPFNKTVDTNSFGQPSPKRSYRFRVIAKP